MAKSKSHSLSVEELVNKRQERESEGGISETAPEDGELACVIYMHNRGRLRYEPAYHLAC